MRQAQCKIPDPNNEERVVGKTAFERPSVVARVDGFILRNDAQSHHVCLARGNGLQTLPRQLEEAR